MLRNRLPAPLAYALLLSLVASAMAAPDAAADESVLPDTQSDIPLIEETSTDEELYETEGPYGATDATGLFNAALDPQEGSDLGETAPIEEPLDLPIPGESAAGGDVAKVDESAAPPGETRLEAAENSLQRGASIYTAVSCLAGNGRYEVAIVNKTDIDRKVRLEFGGLSAREVTVAPKDWQRLQITGRKDGGHAVRIHNGDRWIAASANVRCDSSPATTGPAIQVLNACRFGNGYILVHVLNNSSRSRSYVFEFEGVANRSTTAAAHGSSIRAITGRPDGTYRLMVRSQGQVVHTESITVACDSPAPPPPPPTPAMSVELTHDPFVCDGVRNPEPVAGYIRGFESNEPVKISWETTSATATAANGVRSFRWSCVPERARTITMTATGERSGRSITFQFRTIRGTINRAQRLVQAARDELSEYGGKHECDSSRMKERTREYFKFAAPRSDRPGVGSLSSRDGCTTSWSAVFISWLQHQAGAGTDFSYGIAHWEYVFDALRAEAGNSTGRSLYISVKPITDATPNPGDLLCWWRPRDRNDPTQPWGMREWANWAAGYRGRPTEGPLSHCDVIVSVSQTEVSVIGGNLSNSVRQVSRSRTESRNLVLGHVDNSGNQPPVVQPPQPGRRPARELSLSSAAKKWLRNKEGARYEHYNDPVGHCTIGIGHLVARGPCDSAQARAKLKELYDDYGDGRSRLTDEGLDRLFEADIDAHMGFRHQGIIGKLADGILQHEFDALFSLAYNAGLGNMKCNMPRLMGQIRLGPDRWNTQIIREEWDWGIHHGLAGLTTRRNQEIAMFLDGTYQSAGSDWAGKTPDYEADLRSWTAQGNGCVRASDTSASPGGELNS